MDALKNFIGPLASSVNTSSLQDTMKLVVIGGTMETARRLSSSAWNGFVDSFFLTATFNSGDVTFDWIMHWLSKQPAWGRSREFEITTRAVKRNGLEQATSGDVEEPEDEVEEDDEDVGKRKRKIAFLPSVDTTHTIYFRGHLLRITRSKGYQDYGHYSSLKISVVARNNDILKKLVLEAKREYEKDAEHRVHIFMADTTYTCWRWNGARQKRPMSSIVLEPSVKEMILTDCKDFLRSEEWYAERGIPFRRGYLLYGVPGSGKTSLIHSLAGELNLDIYVVSLSSKGMSDNTLTTLMGSVPQRCILLLEDLDAAFTRSLTRDASSTGAPTVATKQASEVSDGSTLSLSGLLNSLDGVTAAEGRLLFATTNHIDRLDSALSRPGRLDVWVNFKNATRWQAEGIFKNFFPSKGKISAALEGADAATSLLEGTGKEKATAPASPTAATAATGKGKHVVPLLDEEEIAALAKRFGESIPEDEMSVASLQGYLLKNKTRPRECVDEVAEWIKTERETREQIKKEKEEREAEEKKLAEELARKEKEEAEAKEKMEKEAKEKLERKALRRNMRKAAQVQAQPAHVPMRAPPDVLPPPSGIVMTGPLTPPPSDAPSRLALAPAGSSGYESDGSSDSGSDTRSLTTANDGSDNDAPATLKDTWVSIKNTDTNAATASAALRVAAPVAAVAA